MDSSQDSLRYQFHSQEKTKQARVSSDGSVKDAVEISPARIDMSKDDYIKQYKKGLDPKDQRIHQMTSMLI